MSKKKIIKKIFLPLLMIFISLTVTLAIADGITKFVDPKGISWLLQSREFFSRHVKRIPDDSLGYALVPGERQYQHFKVFVNSQRLRERELPLTKAQNLYRILAVGDSVAFGYGVDAEKTFVRLLEVELNRLRRGTTIYQTINMGVPGYNTVQELRMLETRGLRYHPDHVVLIFVGNDREIALHQRKQTTQKDKTDEGGRGFHNSPPRPWYFKSAAWLGRTYIFSKIFRYLGCYFLYLEATTLKVKARPILPYIIYSEEDPGWRDCKKALAEMKKVLERHQTSFTVITFEELPSAVAPFYRSLDIPFYELSIKTSPELRNSSSDGHFNARGHRIATERIINLFLREKIIPGLESTLTRHDGIARLQ
jgi:hypothetical protein